MKELTFEEIRDVQMKMQESIGDDIIKVFKKEKKRQCQLLKFKEKIKVIDNEKKVELCLNKTSQAYRPYDPGWYLYKKLIQKKSEMNIFNDEYLELVYVTLSSWNMNTRAAKLAEFDNFKNILRENKNLIISLEKYKIECLTKEEIEIILGDLKKLFYNLDGLCIQNSKIVTWSKCLHFLLPNLIVPIDRKYTLSFFNYKSNVPKDLGEQFYLYKNMYLIFIQLSKKFDLSKYYNGRWNENIPKVIDNIIIGHEKLK